MPIRTVLAILQEFKRYVDFVNEHGNDELVDAIKKNGETLLVTMRGHCGETYDLEVYLSDKTGELCVENPVSKASVFDFADEYGWTKEDVQYIKLGRQN